MQETNGLEQAIEEFNECKGAATIYYNRNRNEVWTRTFFNDIEQVQTIIANNATIKLWSKAEREHCKIGQTRLATINRMIELFLAGEEDGELQYKMFKEGHTFL